jgi:hypothetical protein
LWFEIKLHGAGRETVRIERSEIKPWVYLTKAPRIHSQESFVSSISGGRKTGYPHAAE